MNATLDDYDETETAEADEEVTNEEIEAEGKRIATDMFIDDQEDG